MLNFTVGPVQESPETLKIGSQPTPYFRTPEFSEITLDNEKLIKIFADSPNESKVVFITGSGTAAMEASIINTLFTSDKVLIVNGGSFGQRFVDLCKIYNINYTEIIVPFGSTLTKEMLTPYEGKSYTTFIVNLHETSTGTLYDINVINDFCKNNKLFLIVDAISSFLCDKISMTESNVDILIAGSQKGLACPPGISIIVLSPRAIERVLKSPIKCMYLDLKLALANSVRGQTPFTPAVSILLQINARLKSIQNNGGVNSVIEETARLASDFRKKITELPFIIPSKNLSNAVTPLSPTTASAYKIFEVLKDDYDIWICPNGGQYKETLFRVGHIGNLTINDNQKLISAFYDLKERKII